MTVQNSNRILIMIAILLAVAIGAIAYFAQDNSGDAVGGMITVASGTQAGQAAVPDTSGWQTYTNANFGFTIQYPQGWELSEDGVHADAPYLAFGNPLNGKQTYALKIWIVSATSTISAQNYVAQLLKNDEAQDTANAKNGPAPQITPRFNNQYAVKAGSYDGYELFNVFEFDQNAEQIYVANGTEILVFDFPIASANPNLSDPIDNNVLAHGMLSTLALSAPQGAFCGGIAAFQCPTGYSCRLDGTYPDAGGHCVVQ